MNRIVIKSRKSPRERLRDALMDTYDPLEDCCFYGIDGVAGEQNIDMVNDDMLVWILDNCSLVRIDHFVRYDGVLIKRPIIIKDKWHVPTTGVV